MTVVSEEEQPFRLIIPAGAHLCHDRGQRRVWGYDRRLGLSGVPLHADRGRLRGCRAGPGFRNHHRRHRHRRHRLTDLGGHGVILVLADRGPTRPADPGSERTARRLRHHPPNHHRVVPGHHRGAHRWAGHHLRRYHCVLRGAAGPCGLDAHRPGRLGVDGSDRCTRGAAITSLLAGSAAAGGAGVAEEPTVSGVLTVENTAFVATSLEMDSGEVLGLFIVNKDPFPHSFDIDSLDIHVQLQPNSTTAVAIKPTGPGNLEFFCGVPGHRQAGMVGTITIGA